MTALMLPIQEAAYRSPGLAGGPIGGAFIAPGQRARYPFEHGIDIEVVLTTERYDVSDVGMGGGVWHCRASLQVANATVGWDDRSRLRGLRILAQFAAVHLEGVGGPKGYVLAVPHVACLHVRLPFTLAENVGWALCGAWCPPSARLGSFGTWRDRPLAEVPA